ncbi:hypothetical protein BD779DRAFT_238011 [Infundibulicybe gibba]|nr:hypothetical protein BD779DRAFT_238011 [Infundibulicybe gibba]
MARINEWKVLLALGWDGCDRWSDRKGRPPQENKFPRWRWWWLKTKKGWVVTLETRCRRLPHRNLNSKCLQARLTCLSGSHASRLPILGALRFCDIRKRGPSELRVSDSIALAATRRHNSQGCLDNVPSVQHSPKPLILNYARLIFASWWWVA